SIATSPGLTPRTTFCRLLCRLIVIGLLAASSVQPTLSQSTQVSTAVGPVTTQDKSLSRYLDQTDGMTADQVVAYALAHNAELEAARKEIEAAKALVKQARLRANPMLDVEGTRQIPPGKDNSIAAGVALPLELNGRRPARIAVAEREVELRERALANRERLLAGEV